MHKKLVLFFVVMVILVVFAGVAMAQDDADCTACHNDTTVITGKVTAWEESLHGTGEAYRRGTSASCAGCHSGGGFSDMIAHELTPNTVERGDPNPTRQDCRACHNIHTSYTEDDWSLETTDPVNFYALEGVTFDGGKGNLCANCHQPRRAFEAVDGIVNVNSTHWGPHYGMQSAILLGVGGVGVEGEASDHYGETDYTCVTCHMVSDNHSFEPSLDGCLKCHDEAENFDIEGVQTRVDELVVELQDALVAKGLLDGDEEHGFHPVVGEYPEAQAGALWNYIAIVIDDGSRGIHNPEYTIGLLEASIAALQ